MKKDIGFWNEQGEYIPDIQEVNEVEMDKEIIIDGVDVAGCEFYQIEANELYPKAQYCGSMRNTFCENESNCYYKQLKRLEQENAELKAENARLKSCLQEIKEIVKAYMPKKQGDYRFSKSLNPSLYELLEQILDLITKAESEG